MLRWMYWRFYPQFSSRFWKKLCESNADYHDDMNRDVFADWFENTSLKNLPQDRNILAVMDNAKYHSGLSEKTPRMDMRQKNNMSSLMTKYHIEIPSPLPFKPVLLEKMCRVNIPKKYVIEEMITAARYSVLRLHPIIVCLTQMEWFGTNWNIMLDIWIYTQVYYQKL